MSDYLIKSLAAYIFYLLYERTGTNSLSNEQYCWNTWKSLIIMLKHLSLRLLVPFEFTH